MLFIKITFIQPNTNLLLQPKTLKNRVEDLCNCPISEFSKKLNSLSLKTWDGTHPNLKHYVPLLNKIDSIFEEHIKKYKLSEDQILPVDVPYDEVELLTTCLNYSYQLLEYSTSRDIYNSHGYVADLMFSNNIDIKISALKLICCLSEKFASHYPMKFSLSKKHRDLLISFIKTFPPNTIGSEPGPVPITVKSIDQEQHTTTIRSPSVVSDQNSPSPNKKHKKSKSKDNKDGNNISLYDCLRSDTTIPVRWTSLNYEYYYTGITAKVQNSKQSDSREKKAKKQKKVKKSALGEGLRTFSLTSESLKKLSLQQIFDKAATVIPKEKWTDFVLHVYIAIAYSGSDFDCLALRGKLVTFKCCSVAAASANISYSSFVGLVFDEEPYLLSYMCDLINPDNHVPREPVIATLRAFVNISNKRNGASDLMRALSGNVNHGLLFHILKHTYKVVVDGTFNNDQAYMNYLYNILANLIESKSLASHLRSAGLMKIFLDFLSLRNNYRMTRSGPLHLIEIFIERSVDAFDDFVANDGFNVIISLLEFEVDFAIENPDYEGGAPKEANLSHLITARQVKLLNFLLKLVISLISTYPGDQMRNLYDSPMLKSLIKILKNIKIFGHELLFNCVRIIGTIINNEPTAYSILSEACVIDTFIESFDTFLVPNSDLLLELPDTINAIALNNSGLSKIKEYNIIPRLFSIFRDVKICKQLVVIENVMNLGHAVDELARHHPELKDTISAEILRLIDEIPNLVRFEAIDFYQSKNGSLYHSQEEENIHTEEGNHSLVRWDNYEQSVIIQCALIFLSSIFENVKDWKKLFTQINMNNFFKFICLENAPFDYSLSKTIIHFRNIIKYIDQTSRSHCLPFLKDRIVDTLGSLEEFTNFASEDVSFFQQFEMRKDGNSQRKAHNVLSKLGIMNCLLFVMSDFYSKLHKYQPNKILDIAELFGSESGLKLIERLCLFFRRLTLEEVILHVNTPTEVAKNAFTLVQAISPKQKEIGYSSSENGDWEGTSAKFKNISILYFNFSRSKFWLRNIFNSFCSINYGRRSDNRTLFGIATRYAVGIIDKYTTTMMDMLVSLKTKHQQIRCGFIFCLLNQLYLNLFQSFGGSSPVNPTMSICLLQNKNYPVLKNLAVEVFALLGTLDVAKIKKASEQEFITIELESLALALASEILHIHADVGSVNTIGSIPNGDKMYSYLRKDAEEYYNMEVIVSIQVQAAIANFVMLQELLSDSGLKLLERYPDHIPDSLMEGIVEISKSAFASFETDRLRFRGRLFPISAATTSPSDYNIAFLKDVGFSDEEAKEVLVFYNDDMEAILREDEESLAENFSSRSLNWKALLNRKYIPPHIEPVKLNYLPKYDIDTIDDLYFHRSTNESTFINYWIEIVQLYPKLASNISSLIVAIFGRPLHEKMEDIINPLFHTITLMDFSSNNESLSNRISSTLTLVGFILSNLSFTKYFSMIEKFGTFLSAHIIEKNIEKSWFSSALMIFTKIFSEVIVPYAPAAPKVSDPSKYPPYLVSIPDTPVIKAELENSILSLVLNIEKIQTDKLLIEVTNIIVLLCNTDERICLLAKSRVLKSLISFVRNNKCSTQIHSQIINVIRRSVECDQVVKNFFQKEITSILKAKSDAKKPKTKDLKVFLDENSALVLRNAALFAEVIGEKCILKKANRNFKSPLISLMTSEDMSILERHGISTKGGKSYESTNTTDIMYFLLSELMVISRKEIMEDVNRSVKEKEIQKKGEAERKRKNETNEIIGNNRKLAYVVFLLQTVAELLFSYTSCKTAFLTFSKKMKSNDSKKPRSTALNMLIHKFITVNPFEKEANELHNVHELLTSLGSACIMGLVSTVPVEGAEYIDSKMVDESIAFSRKFTVDIIIKILKETEFSKKSSIIKYGRIVDLINLSRKLCGESLGNVVSVAVDLEATKNDSFYMAKELLDKKFTNVATGIIARLDMNFPYTEQVSESILKMLSLLGEIKVKYQDAFRSDHESGDGEEEDFGEDLEEKDEEPDLLKNSTLGMYDLDEIEDEDDFDDDFDDEFMVDDGIEIVLSENDNDSDVEIIDELDGDVEVEVDDADDDDDINSENDESELDTISEDGDHDEHDRHGENGDDEIELSDVAREMRDAQIDFVYETDDEDNEMIDQEIDDYTSNEGEGISDSEEYSIEVETDTDSETDSEENSDIIELEIDSENYSNNSESDSDDDSVILQEWLDEIENEGEDNIAGQRSRRNSSLRGHGNLEDSFPPRILLPQMGSNIPISMEAIEGPDGRTSFIEFTQSLLDRRNNTQVPGLLDLRRAFEPFIRSSNHSHFIMIKSTTQRWQEVSELYTGKNVVYRVFPEIINLIEERSEVLISEQNRIKEEKEKERKTKFEEEVRKREEEERRIIAQLERENNNMEDNENDNENEESNALETREPVMVEIGGEMIDIAGTGIDPEFMSALPDDMRVEVYQQHLNEMRVEERGREANGILRGFSLGEDPFGIHLGSEDDDDDGTHAFHGRRDFDEDDRSDGFESEENFEDGYDDEDDDDIGESNDHGIYSIHMGGENSVELQRSNRSTNTNENADTMAGSKKSTKSFFTSLIDKPGIASLLKLLFIPQAYYKRELFLKTVGFLCLNKHSRSDVVALILYILQEGIKDQNSLASVFEQICNRASKDSNNETLARAVPTVCPPNCTVTSLATQSMDVIQYLLENEKSMRFHFLTDQDAISFMKKTSKKSKLKDNSHKYPINILLNLLENKIIKDDANLMDVLSRSIQIATRPLPTMKLKLHQIDQKDNGEQVKKLPQLPNIPDKSLKQIINVLITDECANKVYQQTIVSIQNLSVLENARIVFPKELSKKATTLSSKIVKELRELIVELKDRPENKNVEDISSLNQFSSGSSDSAKLLRILTALDYLYQSKDNETDDIQELTSLYRNSALGPLWGALSDCLKLLREDDEMNYIAFILSPLIEALMVVCKHSKVQRMNVLDVLRYEEKESLDFAKEPIESLFFTFTEEHKKILNHMIRNNPKLMSGPFSVLIRNPKVLEFDNKRVYFDQKLHENDSSDNREKLTINIRRDQVFLDSYRNMFYKPTEKVKKSLLDIKFNGEEGVDAGGVTREWYQVLSRQIFDPNYALFIPVASDKSTFHPNRTSWVNPEHLSYFKFVGMIIGKAVYDGYVLDCHFSRAVFKMILSKQVSLKDMESLDLDYYKSLVWMLENDITDIIVETFSVETDDYGEHKVIDLVPNGSNVSVTEENKQEYVKKIVEYRLLTSVKDQMNNFLEGFYSMIPKDLVSIFDEQELELLVSGLPDIDVDDWRNNTIYENYSPSSPQIQWFWRAVKSFDAEERAKLLQFATGTSKVPLNGFKELVGMNGISKFSVHRVYNSTERLPTAHTCFNQIDLPEYESYGKLRNALLLAIREGHEGFGFA